MKIRFSISLKLLLFILPLVCLPVAIVGYVSIHASVERVNRLVRDEQMSKVRTAASRITDIFEKCSTDIETIAGLPVMEDYHIARSFRLRAETEFNHDNIVRLFTEFLSRTPFYHALRYLDSNGRELIAVTGNGRRNELKGRPDTPYLPKGKKFPADRVDISGIIKNNSGKYIIHWTFPVYSAWEEFAGVIVIDLDFDKIIGMIRQIHVGDRGYAFIVDSDGRIVAHPDYDPYGHSPEDAPESDLDSLVNKMFNGSGSWENYVFEGEKKVAAFAPVSPMNWSVAVTIPTVEFIKEASAIRTRVVQVMATTLVITILTVSILSWFMLRPVRKLAVATNRIAEGDLSQEIPATSSDEFGDLTRSFNRMVKELSGIQKELVRSEKLISLGRLSAGVAHEIRNPLNAMKGAIVHIQRRRPDDALVNEYTQLVSEEIDRLNTFVTEFLYFARQSEPRRVPADVNQLILSTQHLFEKQAQEMEIRFNNRLSQDLPILEIDPHQMEQVLVNIVINAMDAITENGDITFSTFFVQSNSKTNNPEAVRIEIRDNGCGISESVLQDIFDPFFSTKESGTGIGLPLSLGIVENHGGKMTVIPREQRGTKVAIELPVVPNQHLK